MEDELSFIGKWTSSRSFNHRSLHRIGSGLNPCEQAISIIGKTLSAFDEDNLIPCFGFGDASTHDQEVFSFDPEERYYNGFEGVLRRYREIVPHLKLSQVTRSVDTVHGKVSPQEQNTIDAIIKARLAMIVENTSVHVPFAAHQSKPE
ncbi:hypothetical protein RHMOL_Rhmol02G0160200 [Rhododendron molle]|uniref:Uncharacterized protein n=1 Tax=Rhododendron molle TaxID=49168 RepID=A0ACC0PQS9_RHOML|nr:hypothetical protein RHMOL_Rhmol02G0160200 [Rhododendron molle]